MTLAEIVGIVIGFVIAGVLGIVIMDSMIASAPPLSDASFQPMTTTPYTTINILPVFFQIIIIVSVGSIVFILLQRAGIFPRFGEEPDDSNVTFMSPDEAQLQQQQVQVTSPDRFEAILNDGWEL